ncbi:hypothetical protein F1728_06680 [Gimesia benthica]|uniref:Uncharacterized protein n=1 Tax=Gimesia benthica TaxID=2608982 RepID=A0A6I6A8M1_9PLAN|nr:hypothetical protein [Gimesia benthica]QGQ22378.1 hypothetical protein F1728_06680 [Gimesia benthica]
MRGHDIPQAAKNNTIRAYADLHRKFDLFLNGQITSNLLIIARSGVGKSFYLKQNADWRITALLEGNVKALKTYIKLYQHRHKLIVLDDAENLWESKNGRVVLRELTETSYPKTMSWESTAKELTETQTPTTYQTNSRACIICNSFRFGRTDETAAIIDRCQCYCFNPTNEEVVRYVAEWFWDQIVFDYATSNLHVIDNLSARMFVRAWERRIKQDENWRNEFPLLSGIDAIVKQVCNDQNLTTAVDRVKEYERIAKLNDLPASRATFMRHQKELRERGMLSLSPPDLKLLVKGRPPAIPMGIEAILAEIEAAELEQKYFGSNCFS